MFGSTAFSALHLWEGELDRRVVSSRTARFSAALLTSASVGACACHSAPGAPLQPCQTVREGIRWIKSGWAEKCSIVACWFDAQGRLPWTNEPGRT